MAKNTSAEKAAASTQTPMPMRMLPVLDTTVVTAGTAAAAEAAVAGLLWLHRREGAAQRRCCALVVHRYAADTVLQKPTQSAA